MKRTKESSISGNKPDASLLTALEKQIDYRFTDRCLLITALSHSSYTNCDKDLHEESNERLEFLGDSVLSLAVSRKIYSECSGMSEGEMTKMRASIVCKPSLAICASLFELGKYMLMGRGEEVTGGRKRSSTIADCFEALIGAIYLDGGFKAAAEFIERTMTINTNTFMDYKTRLQEIVQKNKNGSIFYVISEETGPDHDKAFFSQVIIGNDIMGKGSGKSKKEAEQDAAYAALESFKIQ